MNDQQLKAKMADIYTKLTFASAEAGEIRKLIAELHGNAFPEALDRVECSMDHISTAISGISDIYSILNGETVD